MRRIKKLLSQDNTAPSAKEGRVILIVALIQFINITDFMMVMPLGPDFAKHLGIPVNKIGMIGGSYTLAAAMAGIIIAFFIDRFQRRRAILFYLFGLIFSTFLGAFVWDEASMLAARMLAGICGGPLTALGLALIADTIPIERRGRAMGKVMGGFTLATVLGVPIGLEFARLLSWHAPFISTSFFGSLVWLFAFNVLPKYSNVSTQGSAKQMLADIKNILTQKASLLTFAFNSALMMSGFILTPNISAFIQYNLGFPRENIAALYLTGGIISLFSMRLAGLGIDKWSGRGTLCIYTIIFLVTIFFGFIHGGLTISFVFIFVAFMVAMTGRNVVMQTLASQVPPAGLRGAFLSLQSTITHLSSAAGAAYSSLILTQSAGKLENMPTLGWTSFALAIAVLFIYQGILNAMKSSLAPSRLGSQRAP